jgi:hypothetical protein
MTVEDWLRAVTADGEARGLPQLTPLLESLALSTRRLRDADFRLRGPGAVGETTEPANAQERER